MKKVEVDIPNDVNVDTDDIQPNTRLGEANLSDADLQGVDLTDAYLVEADLSGANLEDANLSDSNLQKADLTDACLDGADLSDSNLQKADLTDASLENANISDSYIYFTNLSSSYLENANFADANLWGSNFDDAYLMSADLTGTKLFRANLTNADLRNADLSNANLEEVDLTDADLRGADLTDADLERATLVGTELLDADLTMIRPYAARISDVQINDGTNIDKNQSEHASWWQRGVLSPAPRCGYDPAVRDVREGENEGRKKLLNRAADTYKEFEELAHDNSRPSLESSMFVRRQEMQQARYRERGEYLQYVFAVFSGSLFKYGESLGRVLFSGLLIIVFYASVYTEFDLILGGDGFVKNPFDALYFSTLTFTTLGLGDYQPDPASELARSLVTTQAALGAVLIAIFVFVLGRRAAR